MTHNLGDPSLSLSAHLAATGALDPIMSARAEASEVPSATTIVALVHSGGRAALVAADRRASAGHRIAHDGMQKIVVADRMCAVGIAGSVGFGVELARLFALELEHVEKIERVAMSHEAKVRRLSVLVRSHLGLAMQGLGALPILVGWDAVTARPRIHTFDPTGGEYEEPDGASLGSGGEIARAYLDAEQRRVRALDLDHTGALTRLVSALAAASRRDSATSPLSEDAPPCAIAIDEHGARVVPDAELRDHFRGELA